LARENEALAQQIREMLSEKQEGNEQGNGTS
jgi:hypothetical protein